jgi:hypothetical protein
MRPVSQRLSLGRSGTTEKRKPLPSEWCGGATGRTRTKLTNQMMPCSTCSPNGRLTRRPVFAFLSTTRHFFTISLSLAEFGSKTKTLLHRSAAPHGSPAMETPVMLDSSRYVALAAAQPRDLPQMSCPQYGRYPETLVLYRKRALVKKFR